MQMQALIVNLLENFQKVKNIANVKPNPRNGEQPNVYFDNCTKINLRLNKETVGLMDIKIDNEI